LSSKHLAHDPIILAYQMVDFHIDSIAFSPMPTNALLDSNQGIEQATTTN
jgi:hypothetical protein